MNSPLLLQRFEIIDQQRDAIYARLAGISVDALWQRPEPHTWSIGENLDHLRKTLRAFRLMLRIWVPLARPFAWIVRNRPFPTEIDDFFTAYSSRGEKRSNPAGVTPSVTQDKLSVLKVQLQDETWKIKILLQNFDDRAAGHIRVYFPPARNPNLVQLVQRIGFHEQHHFRAIARILDARAGVSVSQPA